VSEWTSVNLRPAPFDILYRYFSSATDARTHAAASEASTCALYVDISALETLHLSVARGRPLPVADFCRGKKRRVYWLYDGVSRT